MPKGFQFLIGTITPNDHAARIRQLEKFQFLIGTITPTRTRPPQPCRDAVSIPHRYDNPCIIPLIRIVGLLVSIPHRYDNPTKTPRRKRKRASPFQFLIGTITPK